VGTQKWVTTTSKSSEPGYVIQNASGSEYGTAA